MGVELESKLSNNAAYTDNVGFRFTERTKSMVILHCGSSLSHSQDGNFGLQVYKPAIRWFLYLRMARLAAFLLCIYGGTS